jgi:hypothetical protein
MLIFWMDIQSVNFWFNWHKFEIFTVDYASTGCSVQVEMFSGHSVGGRSVYAPYLLVLHWQHTASLLAMYYYHCLSVISGFPCAATAIDSRISA